MKGLKDWGNYVVMFPIILSFGSSALLIAKFFVDISWLTVFTPFIIAMVFIVIVWGGISGASWLIELVRKYIG